MLDHLCEELIVEIFTRLPPKSLLRIRSLSKSWYSFISSPGFIRMHAFRSPQKLLFRHQLSCEYLFSDKYHPDDFYTIHEEDQLPLCPSRGYKNNGITPLQFPCSKDFDIVGSCNGIFCMWECHKDIILWNPSIRHNLCVPNFPRNSTGIGFGFDPISDDYKIVCLSLYGKRSFVYALKIGSWCAIASLTPLIHTFMGLPKAWFFNGALHWVVDCYHSESHDTNLSCIITFNLSNHVFGMIPLPEPFSVVSTLTTLQGSLAVIPSNHRDGDTCIWVRRDDSWSVALKLKVNWLKLGGLYTDVLLATTNGDLLLSNCLENVYVYNPKMRAESRLFDFHDSSFIFEIVHYVESLHLLETACKGKRTGTIRYLSDLFYYFQLPFKLLFNMRR